jgi:hypothetical protein
MTAVTLTRPAGAVQPIVSTVANAATLSAAKKLAQPASTTPSAAPLNVSKITKDALQSLSKLAATKVGMGGLITALTGKNPDQLPQAEREKISTFILNFLAKGAPGVNIRLAKQITDVTKSTDDYAIPSNMDGAYIVDGKSRMILIGELLDHKLAVSALTHEFGHALSDAAAAAGVGVAAGEVGERIELALAGKDASSKKNPELYGTGASNLIKVRMKDRVVEARGAESSLGSIVVNKDGFGIVDPGGVKVTLSQFMDFYTKQAYSRIGTPIAYNRTNINGKDAVAKGTVTSDIWKAGLWSYPGGHVSVQTTTGGLQILRNATTGWTMVVDMKTGRSYAAHVANPKGVFSAGGQFPGGVYRMIIAFAPDGKPIWRHIHMDGKPQMGITATKAPPLTPQYVVGLGAAAFTDDSVVMKALRVGLAESADLDYDPNVVGAQSVIREYAMLNELMDAPAGNAMHNKLRTEVLNFSPRFNLAQYKTNILRESSRNGEVLNFINNVLKPDLQTLDTKTLTGLQDALGPGNATAILNSAKAIINRRNSGNANPPISSRQLLNALYTVKMLDNGQNYDALNDASAKASAAFAAPKVMEQAFKLMPPEKVQQFANDKRNHEPMRKLLVDMLTNKTGAATQAFNGSTTIDGAAIPAKALAPDKAIHFANNMIMGLYSTSKSVSIFMRANVLAARTTLTAAALHAFLAAKYPLQADGTPNAALNGEMKKLVTAAMAATGFVKGSNQKALWWLITATWLAAEGFAIGAAGAASTAGSAGTVAPLMIRLAGYGLGLWAWYGKINNQDPNRSSLAAKYAPLIPLAMGIGDLGASLSAGFNAALDNRTKQDANMVRAGYSSSLNLGLQTLAGMMQTAATTSSQKLMWAGLNIATTVADLGSRIVRDIYYVGRAV